MNILLLTKDNNSGGLGTHVINLGNGLIEKGHNVYIAGPLDKDKTIGRYDSFNGSYLEVNFGSKSLLTHYKNLKKLLKITKVYKLDIIHSHNRITSIYAKLINMINHIPFLWTLHLNNIPSDFIHRHLTFYGEKAVVVSNDLKSFCINKLGIPNDKIHISYNGVYKQDYEQLDEVTINLKKREWNIKPEDKVICILGRIDPVKGHKILLEALSKLNYNNYKVLFAGQELDSAYKHSLEAFIQENRMTQRVEFVGYVKPRDILGISDLMVLPSKNEGFAIVVIESFLMKIPVFRTKTGGYNDVKEYCDGFDTIEELITLLNSFFSDKYIDNNKIENAYEFAIQKCTVESMVDDVENVYKEILSDL